MRETRLDRALELGLCQQKWSRAAPQGTTSVVYDKWALTSWMYFGIELCLNAHARLSRRA